MSDVQQDMWDAVSSPAPMAAGNADPWDAVSSQVADHVKPHDEPSVTSDVGKALIGNVAPNAAANLAANLASPLYTAGSYGLQIGTKAGQYVGEGIDSLYNLATGRPQKSQAEYNAEQRDLMNAIRKKIGMKPADDGDISRLIPSPANLLSGAAKAVDMPLYEPETQTGRNVATFGNIATGGAGAGLLKSIPSAVMAGTLGTGLPEVVRESGGSEAAQFFAGLAGGIGGAKMGERTPSETPMSKGEGVAVDALFKKNEPISPQTAADIKARAQDVYRATDELGGALSPKASQDFLSYMKGKEPTTPTELAAAERNKLRSFAQDLESKGFGDNPLTVGDYQILMKQLGDMAWGERDAQGNISPLGREFLKAQQKLREMPEGATPDNGYIHDDNLDGFNAFKYATKLYAQQAKLAVIEKIVHDSKVAPDPAAYQQQQFRNIFRSGKKSLGFTDQEMNMVEKGAKDGLTDKALSLISDRFLFPAAALTGHFDAGVGLAAAKYGLGALVGKLQSNRTNSVADAVRNRDLGQHPDYVAMAAEKKAAAQQSKAQPLAFPSPDSIKTPSIEMPSGKIGQTYDPTDLNRSDDVKVPYKGSDIPQDDQAVPPHRYNKTVESETEPYGPTQDVFVGDKNHLIRTRAAAQRWGISPQRMVVKNGQLKVSSPSPDESAKIQQFLNAERNKTVSRQQGQKNRKNMDVKNFFHEIMNAGGIKNEGGQELISNVIAGGEKPPVGMINKNGISHEAALRKAIEGRWIKDEGNSINPDQTDLSKLYDLLRRGKEPHPEDAGKDITAQEYRNDLEEEAAMRGLDVHEGMTNDQIVAALDAYNKLHSGYSHYNEALGNENNAIAKSLMPEEYPHANEAGVPKVGAEGTNKGVQGNERYAPKTGNAGSSQDVLESIARGHSASQQAPKNTKEIMLDDDEIPFKTGGKIKGQPR